MTRIGCLPNPHAAAADDAGGWSPLYDRVVEALRRHGVGDAAPRAGALFPDLRLPDTAGRYRALTDLIGERAAIVSFQRGLWCPYCSHELAVWAELAPALHRAGVELIVVAAEVGARAAALQASLGDRATLLCDVDHGAALGCGLAFHVEEALRQRYLDHGLDLAEIYGSGGWFLPVPATFLLDADRTVRFAHVDPDFRNRADPRDVAALAGA